MNKIRKAQRDVMMLGLFKIPMLLFCRPRVEHIDDHVVRIRIPLKRRTRNHLKSMYIAVFSIGADIAAGILAFDKLRGTERKASVIFKSFKAMYHKRAMDDVIFSSESGPLIDQMIEQCIETGVRQNQLIPIKAYCDNELVAEMEIELSIKIK